MNKKQVENKSRSYKTFIMKADDFGHLVPGDSVDNPRQPIVNYRYPGIMQVNQLAKIVEHLAGVMGYDRQAFKKSALYQGHMIREGPHKQGPSVYLLYDWFTTEGNCHVDAHPYSTKIG